MITHATSHEIKAKLNTLAWIKIAWMKNLIYQTWKQSNNIMKSKQYVQNEIYSTLHSTKQYLQNEIYSTLHPNMLHDIYFTSPSMLRTSKLYSNSSKVQSTTNFSKAFKSHQRRTTSSKLPTLNSKLTNEGDKSPIYTKRWEAISLMRVHEYFPIPLES